MFGSTFILKEILHARAIFLVWYDSGYEWDDDMFGDIDSMFDEPASDSEGGDDKPEDKPEENKEEPETNETETKTDDAAT